MDASKQQRSHAPEPGRTKLQSGDGKRNGNGSGEATEERHVHRERDVGVGYGNSSGYGTEEHFTDGHVDPIFRVG